MFERANALQEAGTKNATETQVKVGFSNRIRRCRESLFERLRDCVPVVEAHLLLQTLL